MTVLVRAPGVGELGALAGTLAQWQRDDGPVQLHPGDLGWFWRFGGERTARAVRAWERDGEVLAIGLLDGPDLLRLAIAPDALEDEELARQIAEDSNEPARGVLAEGEVSVEAPVGARVRDLLSKEGWCADEPWTLLWRDLAEPVEDPGVAVEVVGPEIAAEHTAVVRASFDRSTFTDERWYAMAAGTPYASARCLLARNERGDAVATVTVWSAGPGRPGVVEPMGVHRDFRGNGYGQAITRAAAAALRELGASSVFVCTPSSNVGAVATYRSAGFEPLAERLDLRRPVQPPR